MKEAKIETDSGDSAFFNLVGRVAINIVALLIVAYIIPGFIIADFKSAIVAAIVIGVLNTFIRPLLQIIFLPLSILTLGIFAFIINVGLLLFAASIVPGFEINGFLTAAVASIALALVNAFFHKLAR